MKRIVIACCILAATGATAFAQNTSPNPSAPQGQQVEPKVFFYSKINELDAHISRKNDEASQKSMLDAANMMNTAVAANKTALASAEGEAKTALGNKVKEQEKLQTEVKILSVDMGKNRAAIKEKLTAFFNTL